MTTARRRQTIQRTTRTAASALTRRRQASDTGAVQRDDGAVTSRVVPVPLARRLAGRIDLPAVSAWLLAFSLVAYLALSNGGYDTVVRGEVGIAVWWIVLVGAARRALAGARRLAGLDGDRPARRPRRCGPDSRWSGRESAERTMVELAPCRHLPRRAGAGDRSAGPDARPPHRQRPGLCDRPRDRAGCALAPASPVVSGQRPPRASSADSARKLSYPLNYWNALAAFAAMGVAAAAGDRGRGAHARRAGDCRGRAAADRRSACT